MNPRDLADAVLEVPIVPGFSRIGYQLRRRLDDWTPLDDYDLRGRVMVVTGATSGLGKAAAGQLYRCGATVVVVGRDAERNEAVVAELGDTGGSRPGELSSVAADLGDRTQVRSLAAAVLDRHDRLDVLIHNAGALRAERVDTSDGIESTVASQVVGPFLLTSLLLGRLAATAPSRVVTVSSGGMYTAALTVGDLQMEAGDYKGTEQYARAKRAQVTLNEMWADRFGRHGVHFHAMHPGWAATPGVDSALPGFSRVMGPLLRSPEEGADTMAWLASDPQALESNGVFWHDRRPRSIHKLRSTRVADTPARRDRLWRWVTETADIEPTV